VSYEEEDTCVSILLHRLHLRDVCVHLSYEEEDTFVLEYARRVCIRVRICEKTKCCHASVLASRLTKLNHSFFAQN
jgi:hypothetical protein